MKKSWIFIVVIGYFLLANNALAETNSDTLVLDLPEVSINGSFIVRIQNKAQLNSEDTQLELWRRFEGGEFTIVSRQPLFTSISQLLYKPGHYEYQVRLVKQVGDSFVDVSSSKIKAVHVKPSNSLLLTNAW